MKGEAPEQPQGHGYLLTGLVLGFALGLVLAWWVVPVQYKDVAPASLRTDFKDAYRTLIAVAYWARPDLVRARARLGLLEDAAPAPLLRLQAQKALAEARQWPWEAEALLMLAATLEGTPIPMAATASPTPLQRPSPTAATPTPQPVLLQAPSPTPTPRQGTPQPTPTVPTLFRVVAQESFCDPKRPALLQIEVYDAQGEPLPGVVLEITWDQGREQLVTGLKPEFGLGYADFQMEPGRVYRLRVVTGSEIVRGLQPLICRPTATTTYPGGWLIRFQAVP